MRRLYADYLVIATGYRNKFDVVPGLGPDGHAQTITTLADAERAAVAWAKFLTDPGPVVIGATQGASCFGAAYEFLFNTSHQLRKAKLHGRAPLTFVTAEPFLGHFGIGGLPGGEYDIVPGIAIGPGLVSGRISRAATMASFAR